MNVEGTGRNPFKAPLQQFYEGTEHTQKNISQDSNTVHLKTKQECRLLGSVLPADLRRY
jgi:hypothetical protein